MRIAFWRSISFCLFLPPFYWLVNQSHLSSILVNEFFVRFGWIFLKFVPLIVASFSGSGLVSPFMLQIGLKTYVLKCL